MNYLYVLLVLLFIILSPLGAKAQGVEKIQGFSGDITINSDASIEVKETIKYYFPDDRHGIRRFIPYRYKDSTNDKYFETKIYDVVVQNENNIDYNYTTSEENDYYVLKIGDSDKMVNGEKTYVISYRVNGVINYFDNYDELYWNATGNSWGVPIENVKIDLTVPRNAKNIQKRCFVGDTGSVSQSCNINIVDNKIEYVSDSGPMTIVAGWDKGLISVVAREYEKNYRYESVLFWLLPLLVLILMIILYFRRGRDPFGRGTIAPEFSPPDDLRPAEMGTLIDEKADTLDITATILDLAVKGYLHIKKKNSKYTLIRIKEGDKLLKDYENDILTGIFSAGSAVSLEDIYKTFGLKKINAKDNLYKGLVENKYFTVNPNKVRSNYFLYGFLIILFSGIFFWLSWNLVFAILLSGIIILIFTRSMPKKTKEGVIIKERCLGFKEFIYRADRYRLRWSEKEHLFEKYLPYAIVFGVTKEWAKHFKDIYKEPPSWYEGNFNTFSAIYFANEMSNFSSEAAHSYSPPSSSASSGSSGFSSGGGFSGGGFGGGGGGSW